MFCMFLYIFIHFKYSPRDFIVFPSSMGPESPTPIMGASQLNSEPSVVGQVHLFNFQFQRPVAPVKDQHLRQRSSDE